MIVGVSKNVGFRVKSCSPSASDIQHFFFPSLDRNPRSLATLSSRGCLTCILEPDFTSCFLIKILRAL